MWTTSLFLSACWTAWCLIQLGFAFYFLKLAAPKPKSKRDIPTGKAAILLAVRGSDPSFRDCLASLLEQSYRNLEIHVVVDSATDPAWEVIREIQSGTPQQEQNLFAHQMEEPLTTCGLKCSALVHGFQNIGRDAEFLVLVDSDVVVHPNWLKELLTPLSDPTIGVATGNQWFEPNAPTDFPSLVRSLWNAGAIVPTVMFRNPWAGSLAMRICDVERAGLINIWRHSIVDDGPIRTAFEPLGLEIEFVPSLLMINRESCTNDYVHQYMRRMLTWSRIYEPTFSNTVVHAIITFMLLISVAGFAIAGLLTAQWSSMLISSAALATGAILNVIGYLIVRRPVEMAQLRRGETMPPVSPLRLIGLFLMSIATQLLYAKSVYGALTAKTIRWRNAQYSLGQDNQCRLLEHQPFVQPDAKSSII